MSCKPFDITIRELIRQELLVHFISLVCGKSPSRFLDPTLPTTVEKVVDILFETKEGEIIHIEFQSTNYPDMAYRMLLYYLLIRSKYPKNKAIIQYVIYIGEDRCSIKNKIKEESLVYSYNLIDIKKDIPCEELIKSDNPVDIIIAGLCNVKDIDEFVQKYLKAFNSLPENKKILFLAQSLTLYELRINLKIRLSKEVKSMGITLPDTALTENPILNQAFEKGVEKGIEKGIQEGILEADRNSILDNLEIKFGNPELSDIKAVLDKIQDHEKLRELRKKTLIVNSLEEFRGILGL